MNILAIEDLSKSFGLKPLLSDVSFGLEDNEKMGLIGANGSGKTTLMRIIAGLEKADGGRIIIPSGARVAYLPQNPEFEVGQSVLDAVFDQGDANLRLLHDFREASKQLESDPESEQHLQRVTDLSHQLDVSGGWDREANATAILTQLGIKDTSAKVETLSGGQRKRVSMARALLLEPALLLLDEPTNHLDTETISWLETYLSRYSGALLLVTHDRYFLDRVTNRMLEVEPTGVTKYEGNYTRYLELKEEQDLRDEATERTRQNLARKELAWLRRGAKARTSKSKYRVKRAIELQEKGDGPKAKIDLTAATTRLGKKVIEIDKLSKSYGDLCLVKDYSQILSKQDRIGIIGPNGSGKTTLLDMIVGKVTPDSGSIELGSTAKIGYFDQEARNLDGSIRVIDTVTEVAENIPRPDGSVITASQMLEKFLFPPAVQYTPVSKLSGGEKRRLHLLLVLMEAPNILLLDEPTNDLDIPTLTALEEYLESFPGVLITVSHDRWFLDKTVDTILFFEGDGSIRTYPGDYTAYLERKKKEDALIQAEKQANAAPKKVREKKASDGTGKLSYKEKRELEEIEPRIEASEARKEVIEKELAENPTDFELVSKHSKELEELVAQLDRDVERWAELAERA